MKKAIVIILSLVMISCSFKDEKKDFLRTFGGKHELRRLSQKETIIPAHWSAGYFLFFGGASGNGEKKEIYIAFSWANYKGEYVLSKVPLDKIRIKFDEKCTVPYITFGYEDGVWNDLGTTNDENANWEIENGQIKYIVIHCKEKEYSPNININQLQ